MSQPEVTPPTPAPTSHCARWKIVAAFLAVFIFGILFGIAALSFCRLRHHGMNYGMSCPMETRLSSERFHDRMMADRREEMERSGRNNREDRDGGWERQRPVLDPAFMQALQEYGQKVRVWEKPYQDKIDAVLTADQKAKLQAGRPAATVAAPNDKAPQGASPERPFKSAGFVLGIIVYQPQLDRLNEKAGLSDKQKTEITQIMQQRRLDFLKFIDQNQPPRAPRPLARPIDGNRDGSRHHPDASRP